MDGYHGVLSSGSVLNINIFMYYLFPTLHTVPFTRSSSSKKLPGVGIFFRQALDTTELLPI